MNPHEHAGPIGKRLRQRGLAPADGHLGKVTPAHGEPVSSTYSSAEPMAAANQRTVATGDVVTAVRAKGSIAEADIPRNLEAELHRGRREIDQTKVARRPRRVALDDPCARLGGRGRREASAIVVRTDRCTRIGSSFTCEQSPVSKRGRRPGWRGRSRRTRCAPSPARTPSSHKAESVPCSGTRHRRL